MITGFEKSDHTPLTGAEVLRMAAVCDSADDTTVIRTKNNNALTENLTDAQTASVCLASPP